MESGSYLNLTQENNWEGRFNHEQNGLDFSNELISDSLFYNLGLYYKNEHNNVKGFVLSNEFQNINECESACSHCAKSQKNKFCPLEQMSTYDGFSSNDVRDSDYSSNESNQSVSNCVSIVCFPNHRNLNVSSILGKLSVLYYLDNQRRALLSDDQNYFTKKPVKDQYFLTYCNIHPETSLPYYVVWSAEELVQSGCVPTHYNNVPENFVSDYINWSAKGSVQTDSFSTYSHSRSESVLSDPIWSVKEQREYVSTDFNNYPESAISESTKSKTEQNEETKHPLSDQVSASLPNMSLLERLSLLCHSPTQTETISSTYRDTETGTNLLDYHYLTFLCYTVLLNPPIVADNFERSTSLLGGTNSEAVSAVSLYKEFQLKSEDFPELSCPNKMLPRKNVNKKANKSSKKSEDTQKDDGICFGWNELLK